MDTADLTFDEFWRLYFPDLLEPLDADDRRMIVDLLASGYLDGEIPGRETVQRVVELETGEITECQYRAWISDVEADGEGDRGVLLALAGPRGAGSERADLLGTLGGFEYTDEFAERVRGAGSDDVLSEDEVREVLGASLRNQPLPPIRERPQDVPDLGFPRLLVVREPYRPIPPVE